MQWSLQRLEILSVCSGMAISLLLPRAEEKKEKYRKKNKIRYLYIMAEKSKGTTEESRKKNACFKKFTDQPPPALLGPCTYTGTHKKRSKVSIFSYSTTFARRCLSCFPTTF